MKNFVLISSLLWMMLPAAAQQFSRTQPRVSARRAPIPDPAYQQLTDDDQFAAYQIRLAAGTVTHRNPHPDDYLLVALQDCDLQIAGAGNSYKMHLGAGEMQVMTAGWAHSIANTGSAPVTLLELDVRRGIQPARAQCGLNRPACTEGRFGNAGGTFVSNRLFQTPTVRLDRIELGPGGTLEQHTHRGEDLLIALSDLDVADDLAGATPQQVRSAAGSIRAYKAGAAHTIQNIGSKSAVFLEFELR